MVKGIECWTPDCLNTSSMVHVPDTGMKVSQSWPQMQQVRHPIPIFMFVNPLSGGRCGEALFEAKQPFEVNLGNGRVATLRIFDMLEGSPGDKSGFHQLKQETIRGGHVRMVIAGGDGTILWAIEEAEKHQINTRTQVMLAVMPLGTGNDFSRFLGWGGKAPNMSRLLKNGCQGLAELVHRYAAAKPQEHDIWRVVMTVDPDRGTILKTNKDRRKEPIEAKSIEKLMHSYFSAGNDARAGMGQEKARTSTRWGNMLNYGFQICIKGLPFRDKEYVRGFLKSLHHGTSASAPVICSTDDEEDFEEAIEAPVVPRLQGNPQVLMILNIPNCYGGLCRFWESAISSGLSTEDPSLLNAELDASDGKLEALTYGNLWCEPVLTRVANSGLPANYAKHAKRVFSGAPMFLQLREEEWDVDVHVQIDGEFFKLKNPTSVTFVLHQKICVLFSGLGYSSAESDPESEEEDSDTEVTSSEDEGWACR